MFANNSFIQKNEITTYKITPDFRVSNENNEILTNTFTNFYESLMSRTSIANINFRQQHQVHFNIVMEKGDVGFYISFPTKYQELALGKLKTCWKKCALDEMEDIDYLKLDTKNTIGAELRLTNYNILPISTSLSDSSHLTSLLQILRAVNKEDKVVINLAIESMPRFNWFSIVEDESKCVKEGKEKVINGDFANVLKKSIGKAGTDLLGLYIEYKLLPFEILMGMVNNSGDEIFNIKEGDRILTQRYEQREEGRFDRSERNERYDGRRGERNERMSSRYFSKKNSDVFKCRITILSSSTESDKAKLNMLSVFESFKELNGENEFYLKQLSHNSLLSRVRGIYSHYVSTDNSCILSTKEVAKLIQLPPKQAQKDFKIKAIDTLEVDIPKEIMKEGIPFVYTGQRGKETLIYRSLNKNILSLPWIYVGSQGSGKTSFMKLTTLQNYKHGISNLVVDILEDCKIAQFCKENIPDNDRVDINISLDNLDNIPSLSFNEVSNLIVEDMNPFTRLSIASNIAEQVEIIVDSIADTTNGKLTDAMVRFLYSASMITFIRPQATLNDVFDVLRYPNKRAKAINYARNSGCFNEDVAIINNLYQLDKIVEISEIVGEDEKGKPIKESRTEVVNNDSLIVGINNRVTQLEKNPYLKKMLRQKPKIGENFLNYIEQGKTIVISMPQYDFPSEKLRDLIATFYTSRLWLAVQSRRNNEDANTCTIVLDEVYTIKGTMTFLKNYMTQFRRHRIGFLTSAHYLAQYGSVWETIKSCGSSYVLLQGTEKEQSELLKEEMKPFEVEDLLKLKRYHGIFIQKYENGYSKYIGRVPDISEFIKKERVVK